MKKFIFLLLFLLGTTESSAASSVRSAAWPASADSAYSDCGFFGIICSMDMGAKADQNIIRVRSIITIYNKNGEEIDTFKVKRIYYENGKCFITPQSKRRYTKYFVVHMCVTNID